MKTENRRFVILRLKTQGVYAPRDSREQIEFLDSFSKKIISLTDTPNLVNGR